MNFVIGICCPPLGLLGHQDILPRNGRRIWTTVSIEGTIPLEPTTRTGIWSLILNRNPATVNVVAGWVGTNLSRWCIKKSMKFSIFSKENRFQNYLFDVATLMIFNSTSRKLSYILGPTMLSDGRDILMTRWAG
jgi:hypothetical protein